MRKNKKQVVNVEEQNLEEDIINEQVEYFRENINVQEWVKFISYYRYYIDKFAVDVLGINLSPFQCLILRSMARYDESMIVACRGLTKSFISAVYFICVACLYSNIKLGIASGKGQQARNVIIQKIKGELHSNPNIRKEIKRIGTGKDDCVVEFWNGSEIRAIVLGQDGENARSWRFQQLLIDEARLVKDNVISQILSPMTKTPRSALINLRRIFGRQVVPNEKGKVIYISSAYLKTSDFYKRFMHHYTHMINGGKEFFVCAFPYQIGVEAGIFEEEDILKELEKPDTTKEIFTFEYEATFVGSSGDSYYPYELTEPCRVLDKCELQQPKKATVSYVIAHDVATSDARNSDNASTQVIKLKEKPNGTYTKELVYMKAHNGMKLQAQRDFLRDLLLKFPNTIKLVIDVRGNGENLPSLFAEPWEYKNEKGEIIECPPLVPDDDDEGKKIKGAIPLIKTISATNPLNNTIYTYMKSCFEDESLRLLIPSEEVDSDYKEGSMSLDEFTTYINTDLLIQELSNIKQEFSDSNNIIYKRITNQTKRDRVTSLGYGLLCVRDMEIENRINLNKTKNKLVFLFN